MQLQDINLLYDYNCWANKRILAATARLSREQFVTPADHTDETLRSILLHTLDSECVWRFLCQVNDHTANLTDADFPGLTEAELPTLEAIVAHWHAEERAMRTYLAELNDDRLAGIVSYTINDKTRNRVLWHCLLHVVNHGTYHRSEAAAMLTRVGQSPGELDFTLFLNETQV